MLVENLPTDLSMSFFVDEFFIERVAEKRQKKTLKC